MKQVCKQDQGKLCLEGSGGYKRQEVYVSLHCAVVAGAARHSVFNEEQIK